MKFCKCILKIAEIASLLCGLPTVAFIFYCELFGYDNGNMLLDRVHFPLSDNGVILICYICAGVFIISQICKRILCQKENKR